MGMSLLNSLKMMATSPSTKYFFKNGCQEKINSDIFLFHPTWSKDFEHAICPGFVFFLKLETLLRPTPLHFQSQLAWVSPSRGRPPSPGTRRFGLANLAVTRSIPCLKKINIHQTEPCTSSGASCLGIPFWGNHFHLFGGIVILLAPLHLHFSGNHRHWNHLNFPCCFRSFER